jgi:hypothetical protein
MKRYVFLFCALMLAAIWACECNNPFPIGQIDGDGNCGVCGHYFLDCICSRK